MTDELDRPTLKMQHVYVLSMAKKLIVPVLELIRWIALFANLTYRPMNRDA